MTTVTEYNWLMILQELNGRMRVGKVFSTLMGPEISRSLIIPMAQGGNTFQETLATHVSTFLLFELYPMFYQEINTMKVTTRSACALFILLMTAVVYGQANFPEILPHQSVIVQWSPQGNLYATGHMNGNVRIYNNTGTLIKTLSAHSAPVFGVAFNLDGSRLATGGYDNALRIWNTSNDTMLAEFTGLGDRIGTLSWSSNGTTIFATSTDGSAHVIFTNIATDSY
jgi:WD40 repeat protein